MSGRISALLGALAVLLVLAPGAQAALRFKPCKSIPEFGCATLEVPVDRGGAIPGTLRLRVAAEPARRSDKGVVIALSGGPGQGAVQFGRGFRETLAPLIRRKRLVLLDERGTGGSAALRCSNLQRLTGIDPVRPSLIGSCAQDLGPARQRYGTPDTVADLDAFRQALGAETWTLMGISYGTFVAQQYARTHPQHTDGLVLDSVLADGFEPFLLNSFSRTERVLREQCARNRCRRTTRDPVADVAAVTRKLAAGPIRGRLPDRDGRLRPRRLDGTGRFFLTVQGGDLNPFLQPAIPAAVAAAARGDHAPLLRAARLASGGAEPAHAFSLARNVTTACADTILPYRFDEPVAERAVKLQRAVDGLGPDAGSPFDVAALRSVSIAEDCLYWPEGDTFNEPSEAPLPDVPALLLAGRLDMRTPFEDAESVAEELPRGTVVRVPGTGHDAIGSDLSACTQTALKRFAARKAIGSPCRGKTNQIPPFGRPPLRLGEVDRVPGVAGRRGRVVEAVLETVSDAQFSAVQSVFAGFERNEGGGLRAGSYRASGLAEVVRLRGYSYIPGVRVTGRIDASGGRVRVRARGANGWLDLDGLGGVEGVLGGRRVRATAQQTESVVAEASSAGGRAPALRAAARLALRQAATLRGYRSRLR
ncbi:MAG TPA: alpha/beta fold hydrolase [Baekduia sp.]|nr:alpha/beta fold hydrolase [Baekduia sp.]